MTNMPNFASRRRIGGLLLLILINGLIVAIAHRYFMPIQSSLLFNTLFHNQYQNNNNSSSSGIRSAYGYRRPRPPFESIRHTSHNCTVPSASGQYSRKVHIPTAVPHLILIGAQKSGTSTIQVVFNRQQNIIKPTRKRPFEPHFFDWDVKPNTHNKVMQQPAMKDSKKKQFNASSEGDLCQYREDYSDFYDMSLIQTNNVSVVFEKTPSYMLYPEIPAMIDAICPWKPKILAILRDPVDRAWSEYQMEVGRGGGGKKNNKNNRLKVSSFIGRINNEILHFQRNGILEKALTIEQFERSDDMLSSPFRFPANMTLEDYAQRMSAYTGDRVRGLLFRGMYAPLLLPWVERFSPEDRLMILHFDSFVEAENDEGNNNTVVNEVLGFAGLADGDYGRRKSRNGRWRRKNSNTDISEDDEDGDNVDDDIGKRINRNIQRQRKKINIRRKLVWKNQREYGSMPPRIRQYLALFYQPFNAFLADLLGEDWRDIYSDAA